MLNNFIYILWTSINVLQDVIYRYCPISINIILISRYVFTLITLTIGGFFIEVPKTKPPIKSFIFINFFKSISSFLGMICVFLQLSKTNIFNTNLIFYTIPAMDYLFQRIFFTHLPLSPTYLNVTNIFNSSLIFIYFAFSYSFGDYIYGFMSAMFFSLSNITIMISKNHWKSNLYTICMDMKIFSSFMLLWSIFYFFAEGITQVTTNLWGLGLITLNGMLIQFLLYYLFLKVSYTPSSLMSYWDLFFAIGIDLFMSHSLPSSLQILLLISIIVIPYVFKKL